MRGLGSHRAMSRLIALRGVRSFWLRRRRLRHHTQRTPRRKACQALGCCWARHDRQSSRVTTCRSQASLLIDGGMLAAAQGLLDLAQLGPHPVAPRLPVQARTCRVRVCPAMWVKPRKSKVSGLPRPRRSRFAAAKRPNSMRRVLSGCSAQRKLLQPLPQVRHKPLGIGPVLKAGDYVVGVAHHDDVALGLAVSPLLAPTDRRRSAGRCWRATARSPHLAASQPSPALPAPSSITPTFSHLRIRRITRRSPIRCSTNRISQSWLTVSKKLRISASRIQFTRVRVIATANASSASCWLRPGPETVAEAEEVLLVDRIQHFDHRPLDDLVFQRRDAERPLPPIRLWACIGGARAAPDRRPGGCARAGPRVWPQAPARRPSTSPHRRRGPLPA